MRKTKVLGIILMILGVAGMIGAAVLNSTRAKRLEEIEAGAWSLGELIDEGEDHSGMYATVTAQDVAYLFAQKEGGGNRGYYFVVDDRYNYIVYMSAAMATKLSEEGELELKGVTRDFTNDLRSAAIGWMEAANDENEITKDNFRTWFGGVYIDTSASPKELTTELNMLLRTSLVGGIVLFLAGVFVANRGARVETD